LESHTGQFRVLTDHVASLREWRGIHQPHRPFNF
jgi:hypothetical protein